ncbi:hypothetical protein OI450_07065 [Pectobacterium cacticida]|uniref:Uncharacterized protein n=1 Tax=Pectobacterium cacticida TaxID=69221 RepID=A0ABZ2G6W2_9GAMM|nr:hypothetical protein [Pectobacterium cacticida]UYX08109.1 hypothetical protein OI450_07065 [Pectobacterium cacticida]
MAKEIDKSGQLSDETKEALSFLSELANKQLTLYKLTITDELKNAEQSKTLPITAIINRDGQTRSYLKKEADNINKVVDEAAGMFIDEQSIATGIGNIIKLLVSSFLGSSEGEEVYREKYLCYTDGISLLRFDFLAWKRNVKTQSLLTHTESVSAYYYTISVVDVTKVDFQTFAALYKDVLKSAGDSAEEIIKSLDDLHKIYDRLRQKTPDQLKSHVNDNYNGKRLLHLS